MRLAIQLALLTFLIAITPIGRAEEAKTIKASLVIKEMKQRHVPVKNPILALARICVNEEGWDSKNGCAAIWQVVNNVRSKTCNVRRIPGITQCKRGRETPLSAMRRLSKRVTGMLPAVKRHHQWTSTLQWNNKPPINWIECKNYRKEGKKLVSLPLGCHGVWKLYKDKWKEIRNLAYDLYYERINLAPCPPPNDIHGPVLAWGCELDVWLAEKRQLMEVDCGDTNNDFYAKPKLPEGDDKLALRLLDPLQSNAPSKLYNPLQRRYGP